MDASGEAMPFDFVPGLEEAVADFDLSLLDDAVSNVLSAGVTRLLPSRSSQWSID